MNGITMPGSEIKAINKVCKMFHMPTCFTAASRIDRDHIMIIQNAARIDDETIEITVPNTIIPKISVKDNITISYENESVIMNINGTDFKLNGSYESLGNNLDKIVRKLDNDREWNNIIVDLNQIRIATEVIPSGGAIGFKLHDGNRLSIYDPSAENEITDIEIERAYGNADTVIGYYPVDYVKKVLKLAKAGTNVCLGFANPRNGTQAEYPMRFTIDIYGHDFTGMIAPRFDDVQEW